MTATKKKPATTEQDYATISEGEVQSIPIERITIDNRNDRDLEAVDKEAIRQLAESIGTFGLQQPVGVVGAELGTYRLIFGHRRLEAVKSLGWENIQARVMFGLDDRVVQEIRAVENLQRQDLNYVEEAFAVAGMVEAYEDAHTTEAQGKQLRDAAIAHVARRVGKSEQWVRDRAFLSRASPKVREFCRDGSLPFPHAREIVKLTSHERQDEVAEQAREGRARWQGGKPNPEEPPMPIDELRKLVGKSLFSLTQVPWKLEVPFAGQPACERCPRNSANQTGLFEHAAPNKGTGYQSTYKEPAVGICTDASCFKVKEQAHRAAVRQAANAVLKEAEGKKAPPVPEFIKPSQVRDEIKDKKERAKERAAAAGKPKPEKPAHSTSYYDSPQYKQMEKFKNARAAWSAPLMKAMTAAVKGDPVLGLALNALGRTRTTLACQDDLDYHGRVKQRAKILTPQACKDLVALAIPMKSLGQLEALLKSIELTNERQHDLDYTGPNWDFDECVGVFEAACEAMGIPVPKPRPNLDKYLAKVKAVTPEPKKGKPAAAKPKGKKKAAAAAVQEVDDAD